MLIEKTHYIKRKPKLFDRLRFTTISTIERDLGFDSCAEIEFYDKFDRKWLTINGRFGKIEKNYSWNGCSPKVYLGLWAGTIDFKETIEASLWHDALVQFYNTKYFPFGKYTIDLIFKKILDENNFIFSNIYYQAVDKFGNYNKSEHNEKSVIK